MVKRADLEFRERWNRARFARAVAVKIIHYRTVHGLTQTELAKQVGTSQSVISRLELGERSPTLATLVKLSARTRLEFHLDIVDGDVALSAQGWLPGLRLQAQPLGLPRHVT